jgi:hypothetical protein
MRKTLRNRKPISLLNGGANSEGASVVEVSEDIIIYRAVVHDVLRIPNQ